MLMYVIEPASIRVSLSEFYVSQQPDLYVGVGDSAKLRLLRSMPVSKKSALHPASNSVFSLDSLVLSSHMLCEAACRHSYIF